MNRISILDSGNSDCIIISAETQEGQKTIVIDGGLRDYNGKSVIRDYLRENSIGEIELLIVTHIHQDHHGGFSTLPNDLSIKKAILPYEDIVLSEQMKAHNGESLHIPYYHELYEYLVRQNTAIRLMSDCCGETFRFGDVELKCLFPKKASDLILPKILSSMSDESLDQREAIEVYQAFKEANKNAESAIWLLSCRGRNIAFLPGDSVASVQKSVLDDVGDPPVILKLTHHGLKFKKLEYYDEDLISSLNPQYVVVTNDLVKEKYSTTVADCASACCGIGVTPYYTVNGTFNYEF